jgi:DHA3 family tetracycline resistance protein-like MFS transporter
MSPFSVYIVLEFCASAFFALIFTVNLLYHVTVVQLSPLQLVLVGTILEATVFLFEIPTGVVADVRSRRLSIIVGYALIGLGFIVEGSIPVFAAVALAQVIWGIGYTFTSGATQAWVADEIGEERAGDAYLRGSQAGQVGALVAIPISVVLGIFAIRLPIVLGGGLMIGLAAFLALVMSEEGFKPTPPEERSTWGMMLKTVKHARQLVQRQPALIVLLVIALFYGLYSEGFDRLWAAHLLQNYQAPWGGETEPVAWFGMIRAVVLVVSLAATEIVRRRVDTERSKPIARALILTASLVVLTMAGFGLARNFWIALVLFWLVGALRRVGGPLQTAWFNLQIDDPQVRATTFSASGQADAIGQVLGGPAVGAIGNLSIRAALVASALLLSPVIPLYAWAMRRGEQEPDSGS